MNQTKKMMLEWLESGTDAQKAHARHRLTLPFDDEPTHDYPPVTTQLANAAGALVRAVASGFSRVEPEEHARRKAICEGCEYYDEVQERCKRCGCVVAVKAWLNSEKCPIGKW